MDPSRYTSHMLAAAHKRKARHSQARFPQGCVCVRAKPNAWLSLSLHTRTGARTRCARAGGVVIATWTAVVADGQRVSFRQPRQRERRRARCADWRGANRRPALAADVEAARGKEGLPSGAGGVRVGRSRKRRRGTSCTGVCARGGRVCAAALQLAANLIEVENGFSGASGAQGGGG